MKKENIIIIVIVCLSAFLSFYIYENNKKITQQAEEKVMEKQRKWLAIQANSAIYDFSKVIVSDSTGTAVPIMQLAGNGKRIGLYVDNSQCIPCWEKEVNYLKTVMQQNKDLEQPFLVVCGFNARELRVMKKEYAVSFPIYTLLPPLNVEMNFLASRGMPFFFAIQADGVMSSILFPDDAVRPLMNEYFEAFANSIKKAVKKEEGITLLNSIIDLGQIRPRKKYDLVFSIRNDSKKECILNEVSFSCDCISNRSYPNVILPGETGKITMTFLSTDIGAFQREILVKTNFREEPYKLVFKGAIL